ncbi:MAG: Pantothenate synthetase [Phycisphaerae bacterium]|nr:Pantothenate synthetase [Phycisphaerae bacterium]
MFTIHTIEELRRHLGEARAAGKSVGLVPTMGALHDGHAALVRRAVERCDYVVVSIFVNPTQFGPGEDLDRYPRSLEGDCSLVDQLGADLVFAPSAAEMYPAGYRTHVEVEGLSNVLCGASRPGHFRGVCTVVAKLFNLVLPDVAFFGQKDAQQVIIIQRMVTDLNFPVELEVLPTVREPDGLAMSSRNRYLTASQRADAVCLFRALQAAFEMITGGERNAGHIRSRIEAIINDAHTAEIDYVEIVDADTLEPLADLADRQALIALAVRVGQTRLIDNFAVDLTEGHGD